MRIKHLPFLCFLALLTIGATCERPLDITIEEPDPQLVIISNFTDTKDIMVQVLQSQSVLDVSPIKFVREADVSLFIQDLLIQELELIDNSIINQPFYSTKNFQAQNNVTYTIKVEVPGFETITAESMIPEMIKIQNLKVSNYVSERTPDGETNYNFSVTIDFEDPEEVENFYHLNLYQKTYQVIVEGVDTTILEDVRESIQFSEVIDNNFILANEGGGVLFDDTPFNGKIVSYTFPISFSLKSKEKVAGELLVELRSVSRDYYRYQRSLSQQQKNPGAPFAEPVILYNNVMNGQGIFAGYSAALDSVRIGR